MDRELAAVLADLGLSATEASIYVALLKSCGAGPVTAYKLAQDMGRDPANLAKVLASMCKRGAVRASSRRPRLYAPTAPEDFTGRLIARLQDRRQRALDLLRSIGDTPPDRDPLPLGSRREALARARLLIRHARRVVLIDGTAELLGDLGEALREAAAEQGALVMVLSSGPVELPGIRVYTASEQRSWSGMAPGPWLQLAVDGEVCLQMLAHPSDADRLIDGHWCCCAARVFLAHRTLAGELILANMDELLRENADVALARRKVDELAWVLQHEIAWRERWREAGLPDYEPAIDADRAPADGHPEAPQQPNEVAQAAAAEPDGSLHFVFRRRKT